MSFLCNSGVRGYVAPSLIMVEMAIKKNLLQAGSPIDRWKVEDYDSDLDM